MTRFVPVTVLAMLLVASRVASAQATGGGTLPSGVTVTFDKLYIHDDGSKDAVLPKTDPDSLWHYFNLAHCQCSKAQPNFVESTYEYLLLASASTPPINEPLNIWIGTSCNTDATTRNAMCHQINQSPQISTIQSTNSAHVVLPIYDAMNPEPSRGDCQQRVFSATVWGLADSTVGSGLLDYSTTQTILTDSAPPPLPSDSQAAGLDGAIEISWKPNVDTSDVFGYQALCAVASTDGPGKTSGQPPQRYMTATTLCGLPSSVTLMPSDIATPPDAPDAGGPVTLTSGLADLDPKFLCGEQLSATATNLRINGLQNGIAYKVVLLVVDKYQNVAGTYFTSTVTPGPSTDDRGRNTEGGLCLLAETYGNDSALTGALRAFRDDTLGASRAGRWLSRAYYATLARLGVNVHGSIALRVLAAVVLAPAVALALLWHWLTLPGLLGLIAAVVVWLRWRRALARRTGRLPRPRTAASAVALSLLALVAGRAHASGHQPYWEDSDAFDGAEATAAEAGSGDASWHVGVRIGPYVPAVDGQFGRDTGHTCDYMVVRYSR